MDLDVRTSFFDERLRTSVDLVSSAFDSRLVEFASAFDERSGSLDAKLSELGRAVTAVLLIDVSDEEVVRRLGGRRTCEAEGHVYHVDFNPPKTEGICDIDGSPLIVRDDDRPEVIRKRLATYHEKTEPLVSYYEGRGVLRRVEGEREPATVTDELRGILAAARS